MDHSWSTRDKFLHMIYMAYYMGRMTIFFSFYHLPPCDHFAALSFPVLRSDVDDKKATLSKPFVIFTTHKLRRLKKATREEVKKRWKQK